MPPPWLERNGVCVLCHRRTGRALDLCSHCEFDFAVNANPCPRCAIPMAGAIPRGTICGRCIQSPPAFSKTLAPYQYDAPLTHLIPGLKSGNGLLEARVLSALAAPFIEAAYATLAPEHAGFPDVLVPIPLSYRRRVQRGYNQAALIARCLGAALGVRVDFKRVRRVRHGPPQHTLSARRRNTLAAGVFRAVRPFAGERVAIVDDVMTTGATVQAAATTLLNAGAAEVHVWVTARTGGDTLVMT